MNDHELKAWVNSKGIGKKFQSIVVDFTPILPGGDNGGAKVFLLELIKKLALSSPTTQFTLLTKFLSHEELSHLDSRNIRRLLVIDETGPLSAEKIIHNNTELFSPSWSQNMVKDFRDKVCSLLVAISKTMPERFILRRAINRLVRILNARLQIKDNLSFLSSLNADLLLCPFTAMPYFELGVPAVCIIYDLQHKTYPQFFDPTDVEHRDRIFNEASLQASQITAISDYSRKVAMHYGQIQPDRIRTNYLRMSQRVIAKEKNFSSSKITLDTLGLAEKKFLLYPANFWLHKNHEMLLTAFGIARNTGLPLDIKLVCTGAPGARRDYLMMMASKFGLAENIIFPGYVSNDELSILMSSSCAMIFPSLYEGFGLPVIEAMANEIPVACSNVTSLPEVVASAAITFNPKIPTQIADAMIEIVCNQDKVQSLKLLGKERAKIFADSAQMTKEYWELFEASLSQSS